MEGEPGKKSLELGDNYRPANDPGPQMITGWTRHQKPLLYPIADWLFYIVVKKRIRIDKKRLNSKLNLPYHLENKFRLLMMAVFNLDNREF